MLRRMRNPLFFGEKTFRVKKGKKMPERPQCIREDLGALVLTVVRGVPQGCSSSGELQDGDFLVSLFPWV